MLKDLNGVLLKENNKIENHILEHMTKQQEIMLKKSNVNINSNTIVEDNRNTRPTNGQGLTRNITREELLKTIKGLKNGKATGTDRIPNEFIKNMGEKATENLVNIFNNILKTSNIPKDWTTIRVRLLYNGKGKDREEI